MAARVPSAAATACFAACAASCAATSADLAAAATSRRRSSNIRSSRRAVVSRGHRTFAGYRGPRPALHRAPGHRFLALVGSLTVRGLPHLDLADPKDREVRRKGRDYPLIESAPTRLVDPRSRHDPPTRLTPVPIDEPPSEQIPDDWTR